MGWFKKKDPAGDVKSVLKRVVAYQKAGKLEKAKDAMQEALELAPEDPKVWCIE